MRCSQELPVGDSCVKLFDLKLARFLEFSSIEALDWKYFQRSVCPKEMQAGASFFISWTNARSSLGRLHRSVKTQWQFCLLRNISCRCRPSTPCLVAETYEIQNKDLNSGSGFRIARSMTSVVSAAEFAVAKYIIREMRGNPHWNPRMRRRNIAKQSLQKLPSYYFECTTSLVSQQGRLRFEKCLQTWKTHMT